MEKEIKKSEEEKLTVKQLSVYLPYSIKGLAIHRGNEIVTLFGIGKKLGNSVDCKFAKDDGVFYVDSFSLLNFKPILRPISDLTKKTQTIDGDIIPIEGMFLPCGERDILKRWAEENKCWLGAQISYLVYQNLFENHFDVFGLIEKGLAVDINTI